MYLHVMPRQYAHDVMITSVNKEPYWLRFTNSTLCLHLMPALIRKFDIVFHRERVHLSECNKNLNKSHFALLYSYKYIHFHLNYQQAHMSSIFLSIGRFIYVFNN